MISPSQRKDNPAPFCETSGAGKNPILLIHGFGLNRRSWYDIAPVLADNSTLYMVDLIGFGDSPAPENYPYTMEAQAETLLDLIRDASLSGVDVVGHSYGGGVALMLLHRMIEDGSSALVKNLVLIAPAAHPQALPFFVALPRVPVIGRAFLTCVRAEFQIKTTMRKIFSNKAAVTEERVQRYAGNIARPSHRNALIRTARNIIPRETDRLLQKIKKIQHRTLLIYGENDTVISKKNLERLSGTLTNAVTHIVGSCGHVPQEEYPGFTAGLMLEFLRTRSF